MEETTFTHIGKIYGIKCFYNENTMEVKGTNFLNELFIDLRIKLEIIFPIKDGFYIQIIEPLENKNHLV